MLNYEQIKELIKAIDSSSLRIFELESEEINLRLSKNECGFKESKKESLNESPKELIKKEITKAENSGIVINNTAEVKEEINIDNTEKFDFKAIKSPLVGTYYSSGIPGGKPYVEAGSKVKKGDVICIVEAMKIMNEIKAEENCEIVEVLRNDEEIVEFGMELFKIK